MKYRVTFMERTNAAGDPSEDPRGYVDANLSDGVVLDATFVERAKPTAMHVEEQLEEDDDFLSVGSETWEYDVADGAPTRLSRRAAKFANGHRIRGSRGIGRRLFAAMIRNRRSMDTIFDHDAFRERLALIVGGGTLLAFGVMHHRPSAAGVVVATLGGVFLGLGTDWLQRRSLLEKSTHTPPIADDKRNRPVRQAPGGGPQCSV